MKRIKLQWYASGGPHKRLGPFMTQLEAWAKIRSKTRQESYTEALAAGTKVWPELRKAG